MSLKRVHYLVITSLLSGHNNKKYRYYELISLLLQEKISLFKLIISLLPEHISLFIVIHLVITRKIP